MAGDQSIITPSNEYDNKLLNGEGLLHLVGTIKTEISNAGGGGATYTAGDGIDIDENNVISKESAEIPLFTLLAYILTSETGVYNQNATNNIWAMNKLNRNSNNFNIHINNLKNHGMTFSSDGTSTDLMRAIFNGLGEDPTVSVQWIASNSMTAQYTLSSSYQTEKPTDYMTFGINNKPTLIIFNKSIVGAGRWYFIKNPSRFFQNHYFNSLQGLTSHSIAGAIDELAQKKQNTLTAGTGIDITNGVISATSSGGGSSLPTDPVNDGTYFLTTTVSSGTATQAWTSIPNASGNNF